MKSDLASTGTRLFSSCVVSSRRMYLPFALLLTGGVFLYGQTSPRTLLDQTRSAFAASRDAELLSRPFSLDDLTEEHATELEQAARRQLDRAKAGFDQQRTLVEAGLAPAQSLVALTEEQEWAQTTYDLTLSRADLIRQRAEFAHSEQQMLELPAATATIPSQSPVMERFDGRGVFTAADFHRVQSAFEQQFHKELPVSAEGETAVHRSLGFDHRGRVDVALFPDTAEGKWLRHFLELSAIPYYAFRSLVPGKATAAHIHIGPASTRLTAHAGA
jgi:hypothetical protein